MKDVDLLIKVPLLGPRSGQVDRKHRISDLRQLSRPPPPPDLVRKVIPAQEKYSCVNSQRGR